jgi:nondiscriminating glutamyl-tRNA synthetase
MTVRTRFAPSPTGYVHVGSLRTALYNYLFAKKNKGDYILRIEDTDQSRFVEGSIENLLNCMAITKINHDEGICIDKDDNIVEIGDYGPYVQSERLDLYNKYIKELLDQGVAYPCFCKKERLDEIRSAQKEAGKTPKYDRHCCSLSEEEISEKISSGEPYVIRLKLPDNEKVTFNDLVRGEIEFNTEDLDDQVLIKSDGYPTYHFAVVVDDYLMKISHIIRGEEWLSSTPKHVLLYQAFGWKSPEYVHLPNILNSDKKKLSKRQGDVAVEDFIKKGYLPEALVNYLALLGWSPDTEEEFFDIEELVSEFDISRVNKSGAVFDREKLNWMNGQYIKNLETEVFTENMVPFLIQSGLMSETEVEIKEEWLNLISQCLREKIDYFAQIPEKAAMFFTDELPELTESCRETLKGETVPRLKEVLINKINEVDVISPDNMKQILKSIQKEEKIKGKNLYMPTRIMVTGEEHGPDLMLIMTILGKEKVLKRIGNTII